MEERNRLIYSQAKIGEMTFVELAKIHRLKESAIRKIVGEQKKKEEAIDK
jgi:Mor family transcriptional regulator